MFCGSGEMSSEDRKAFDFLYVGTTLLLRYPAIYPQLSTSTCIALMDANYKTPPGTIKASDFSLRTRPLLKDFLKAADQMVQEFAQPLFLILAFISGQRVLVWAKETGRRLREIQDLHSEARITKQWRDAGAALALGATA
jgi:hypothetical protein